MKNEYAYGFGVEPHHETKLDYADFIAKYPWDLYSTVTFREKRTDGLYWTKRIWQTLEKFDATRAFIACEPSQYQGIHFHMLSRHIPALERTDSLWKYCFKAFGRSQIEVIDSPLAVARYCSKYIVKGNEFDFKGTPEAWTLDY